SLLQTQMCVPEFRVRNARHCFGPNVRIAKLYLPILAYIVFKQITQQRRNPCRRMNSVGDVTDRNIFDLPVGEELLPQRARDFAMFATDTVGGSTHANSQRC